MYSIYKIKDNTNNNVYIGQTKKLLSLRISNHISDFSRNKYCSSEIILKNNDWSYELLDTVNNKNEADVIERYLIRNTENCINKIKYDMLDKKEYDKIRYENNKEDILIDKKFYYNYTKEFGGDPRSNNNLLKINLNIFS